MALTATSTTEALETKDKETSVCVPTSPAHESNGFNCAPEWGAKIQRVLFSEEKIQRRYVYLNDI
jgi:hypothetical protein